MPNKVYPANPHEPGQLHSLGNASYMFMRQYNFPDTYGDYEKLVSLDSDRVNFLHFRTRLKIYGVGSDSVLDQWIMDAPDELLMQFIADMLMVRGHADWTGYRVMASVGGNGHTILHFALFAKDPASNTVVYTGHDAPNILPGRRTR